MHWIQTIREHLALSQKELAGYLGLSVHTINAVEIDRRQLPMDSLQAAITLFNAIKDRTRDNLDGPFLKTRHQTCRIKGLHRKCRNRLERSILKLEKMQKTYKGACLRLKTYDSLAEILALERHRDGPARLRWAQQKMAEARQDVEDNSITAQHLLVAEIAGLKSMVHALEDRSFAGKLPLPASLP